MSLTEKINRYASQYCGQISHLESPIFDPINLQHIVQINARYPVYIFDDRNPSEYKVRILNFDRIGKIVFNEKEEIVLPLTTSSERLSANLDEKLKLWMNQIENIVISCTTNELIKINEFKLHLTPLVEIYNMLLEYGKITKYDWSRYNSIKERMKYERYLSILEGMNMIRKNNDYYESDNELIGIEKEPNGLDVFLANVFKNRYIALRDICGLTVFERVIGIENVIYMPEIELHEPVYRTKANILIQYKRYYNKRLNPMNANNIFKMLRDSGAIEYDNKHYFGVDELRENMIKEKDEFMTAQLTRYM